MRMKQIHRRILGGCLACLLCFTGSIPAFAAETATPANADERTEILPDLESEASETLDNGTPETPEAPEEVSLILVTEIQNEGELRSCQISPCPLEPHRLMMTWRKFISWPFSIKPFAPLYQQVKKSGRKHFLSHGIFRPLTRPLRANIPQQAGLNCRRGMPLVKLSCRSFRFPSGWKKCRLLSLPP